MIAPNMDESVIALSDHSGQIDIWAEYAFAASQRTDLGIRWLVKQGVPRQTLYAGPEFAA